MKKTFHENSWWDHHERWKDMRYRWLPTWKEIPKHLHESALLSHLEELEVNNIKNLFKFLTPSEDIRIAVFSISSTGKKLHTFNAQKAFF